MGVLEHVGHRLLGVAHEHHRGLSRELLNTPREGAVSHVVLHDVDQCLVDLLVLAGKLVKADAVPVAHQANLAVGIADKQLRGGDL